MYLELSKRCSWDQIPPNFSHSKPTYLHFSPSCPVDHSAPRPRERFSRSNCRPRLMMMVDSLVIPSPNGEKPGHARADRKPASRKPSRAEPRIWLDCLLSEQSRFGMLASWLVDQPYKQCGPQDGRLSRAAALPVPAHPRFLGRRRRFPACDAGDDGGLPGDTEAGTALPPYRSVPLVSLPYPASQRRVLEECPVSSNCSLPAGTIRMALDLTMVRRTGARRRLLSWYSSLWYSSL